MSTATLAAETVPARRDVRATQSRILRAEWIKFRSVRSTVVTLVVAAVVLIGLGLVFAAVTASGGTAGDTDDPLTNPADISLSGTMLAQLIVGTLGVLIATGEYTSGLIRATLAAVPERLPVLWAKVGVFAGVTFPVMTAAALIAFLGGQAILGDGANAALGDDGVLTAIAGTAFYITVVGVLGLALGVVLRNTGASIAVLFATVFVAPGLIGLLPDSVSETVGPLLPSNLGSAVNSVATNPDLLSAGPAIAVLLGYVAALLAGAAVLLKRRDA